MLKWLIKNRMAAFEKRFGYDMTYARELLATDTSAFFALAKIGKLSNYRRDAPKELYWSAKLAAVLSEDCGPCTQLVASMAIADGVDGKALASVIANDRTAMTEQVALAVDFTRASIAHDIAADELRDKIVATWGQRALISLAFAITSARIYPTLKYALGHGKACQRVVIDGKPVPVSRAA